jgi:glycosyltransferase involved in cell wall biosynthesis
MTTSLTFTVFTPTFNRAHTLEGVYRSLAAQTYLPFEWVIVDDGSSDGTKELVMAWQSEGKVPIRYFYQENQGKPAAYNRAVREAFGEFFLVLDSDDACKANTLERFLFNWQNISPLDREGFSGVTCHCEDAEGRLVGTPFPADIIDSTPIEMHLMKGVKGEKWGFHRTEVLRRFPFPQFSGEKFIPEGLVWNRIARTYKVRFVNESLRIYRMDPDGLSSSLVRFRASSPLGMKLYYKECLDLSIPFGQKMKVLTNYLLSSLHAGGSSLRTVRGSGGDIPIPLRLAMIPFGFLMFKWDQIRSGRARK